MSATFAASGQISYSLSDGEAKEFAELAIATGAPSAALARVVLRLLAQRPDPDDIEQISRYAELPTNVARAPRTCEAISRISAAYRRQP